MYFLMILCPRWTGSITCQISYKYQVCNKIYIYISILRKYKKVSHINLQRTLSTTEQERKKWPRTTFMQKVTIGYVSKAKLRFPLKKGTSRLHITEARKGVTNSIWASNRWINNWHICPVLLKVGDTMLPSNFWAKTRLDCPHFQLLPVNWLQPLVALDFITPHWSTA